MIRFGDFNIAAGQFIDIGFPEYKAAAMWVVRAAHYR